MDGSLAHGEQGNFFRFLTSASSRLEAVAGVRYAEIARSLHPNGHAARHAFEGGVAPETFAEGILVDEGFRKLSDFEDARAFNLAITAIAEFAYVTPGWHRSADGTYFSSEQDLTLTIRPVADKTSGTFGFGVEVRPGSISPGGTADELGAVEARFASTDIAEAVGEGRAYAKSHEGRLSFS